MRASMRPPSPGRRFDFWADPISGASSQAEHQPKDRPVAQTSQAHLSHQGAGHSAILPTYARADVTFERGEGCWLITVDGERYLDFGAGIAVNALGHAHPHLVNALTEQAGKLWHLSNLFPIP